MYVVVQVTSPDIGLITSLGSGSVQASSRAVRLAQDHVHGHRSVAALAFLPYTLPQMLRAMDQQSAVQIVGKLLGMQEQLVTCLPKLAPLIQATMMAVLMKVQPSTDATAWFRRWLAADLSTVAFPD